MPTKTTLQLLTEEIQNQLNRETKQVAIHDLIARVLKDKFAGKK